MPKRNLCKLFSIDHIAIIVRTYRGVLIVRILCLVFFTIDMKLTLISSLMTIINVHNNLLFQALLIALNSLSAHIHCFFRINILTAMWHMQTDNDTFLFAIIPEGYCYMVLSNILWFCYGQKPCWNRMNKTFNNSRFKCIILIPRITYLYWNLNI